jgi:hypothetical protein
MPEKEGQIKSLLPYDTSRGGQVITQIDLSVIDSNRSRIRDLIGQAQAKDGSRIHRNQPTQSGAVSCGVCKKDPSSKDCGGLR